LKIRPEQFSATSSGEVVSLIICFALNVRFQAAALRMGLNLVNKNLESGYVAEPQRKITQPADLKIETENCGLLLTCWTGKR